MATLFRKMDSPFSPGHFPGHCTLATSVMSFEPCDGRRRTEVSVGPRGWSVHEKDGRERSIGKDVSLWTLSCLLSLLCTLRRRTGHALGRLVGWAGLHSRWSVRTTLFMRFAYLGSMKRAVASTSLTGGSSLAVGRDSMWPSTQAFRPSTLVVLALRMRN